MRYIVLGIAAALVSIVVLSGPTASAGEQAAVPEPAAAHTLSGQIRTETDGAAVNTQKKRKSLTRSLREYSPKSSQDDPVSRPGEDLFGVEKDPSIRYDERKTRKKHSAAGFEKTKEDFVDPKSVMTK